jgi:hypothetical protein
MVPFDQLHAAAVAFHRWEREGNVEWRAVKAFIQAGCQDRDEVLKTVTDAPELYRAQGAIAALEKLLEVAEHSREILEGAVSEQQ